MSMLESYLLSAASAASSQFWLDVAFKATALLLAAMIGTALLRRSSAALRHRVWCLTFAALALLPTLSAALPQWRLAILPAGIEQRPAVETMPVARTETARPIALGAEAAINEPTAYDEEELTQVQSKFAGDRITPTRQSLPPAADDQPAASLDAPRLLGHASIWLLGAAIALLPLVAGSVRTMFLRRQSRPIDDAAWGDLLGELCRRLALRRTVALFETASALMPMTWGLLRPIVLLPAQARCWSNQLRRVVLLHELAHVKRFDVGFQMLARATCAVYWFHPLAWYALRRLRIERELASDDCVVHAGERASDYAAELLEVARSCQPVPLAAAVAMAQRSGLEHRIRALFDSACSHLPLSARAARVLLVGVMVPATTIAAVRLAPRASAADERQDSSENAASNDDDLITISGRVVDPQGKPFAGANIFAVRWYWEPHIPHAPLGETKSDVDGRFAISYRKSQFNADLGRPDQWKEVAIVATAKGFGPGWMTWRDIPAGQSPTLKLVPDDAPISGRIVDLEGNPIAGVSVRVGDIYNGKEGNLDGWLQAVRRGEFPWTAARHLGDSLPQFDAWPPRAVTAEDGRFVIHGLGRERRVRLTLNGATIAYQQVTAVTRPCKPLQLKISSMSDESTPVYGADFELVAPPTQPIIGVVRDADTGQPLGGVSIESNQFAGSNYINERQLRAVSDEQGRYRLVGMPKGKGNVLLAVPNDDQPYLMREFKVPESRGLEPVELDIELHRGVWITGRVTDKSTGEPLMARLYYLPFRTNEYAQQTPEFGEMGRGHGFQDRYSSRPDGSFRLVGLPGRAIVGALCVIGHYRDGVGAEAIEGMNDRGNFPTFRNPVEPGRKWPHAMQEINPPTGAESVECDLALDPGGKITVNVQKREGKPVSGFKTIGSGQTSYGEEIERTSFDVITLGPDETRTVVIRHKPQKLGKVVQLRLADHPTGSTTVTLEPTAKVVGRLLDKQGEPVSGAEITAWVLPIEDFGERLPPVTTDEHGRFEYDDIPLGCRYQLDANAAAMRGLVARDLEVVPGETKDLGDISPSGDKQAAPESDGASEAKTVAATIAAAEQVNANRGAENEDPKQSGVVTVRGVVFDPAGQPLPGAKVLVRAAISGAEVEPLKTTTTAAAGRYEISFRWPLLDERIGARPQMLVVAVAEGCAADWQYLKQEASAEVDLRLPAEQSIEGRIVNAEGTPLADIELRVDEIERYEHETMEQVLSDARQGRSILRMYKDWGGTPPGQPARVKTGADGRFRLAGLATDTVVKLHVRGAGIRHTTFAATTAAPNTIRGPAPPVDPPLPPQAGRVLYGSRFDYVAEPGRSIQGVVRDRPSGRPVAGVKVHCWSATTAEALTDAAGRYVLEGCGKQPEYLLSVDPPSTGPPYFPAAVPIADAAGLEPLVQDVELMAGIELTGKVVDSETGGPLVAGIYYAPILLNVHAASLFAQQAELSTHARSRPDGSFRIVVAPGPGALSFDFPSAAPEEYASLRVTYDDVVKLFEQSPAHRESARSPELKRGWPDALPTARPMGWSLLGQSDARVVLISPDEQKQSEPLEVRLLRGRTLRGRLTDPAGNALAGATAYGLNNRTVGWRLLPGADFTVTALAPGERRDICIHHQERKLGAFLTVAGGEAEPLAVQLEPDGGAKGRVVDERGDPVEGVHVWFYRVGDSSSEVFSITDAAGRFDVDELIPGQPYEVSPSGPGGSSRLQLSRDAFRVRSGQTHDLGDLTVKGRVQAVSRETQAAAQPGSDGLYDSDELKRMN